MEHAAKSIRPFIGAKDFEISRDFYRSLGFEEIVLTPKMSYFKTEKIGFYLQDAYVQDWIDNTMIFLEVDNLDRHYDQVSELQLPEKFDGVRLVPIQKLDWGREYFLHDPSGILWHFGEFAQ